MVKLKIPGQQQSKFVAPKSKKEDNNNGMSIAPELKKNKDVFTTSAEAQGQSKKLAGFSSGGSKKTEQQTPTQQVPPSRVPAPTNSSSVQSSTTPNARDVLTPKQSIAPKPKNVQQQNIQQGQQQQQQYYETKEYKAFRESVKGQYGTQKVTQDMYGNTKVEFIPSITGQNARVDVAPKDKNPIRDYLNRLEYKGSKASPDLTLGETASISILGTGYVAGKFGVGVVKGLFSPVRPKFYTEEIPSTVKFFKGIPTGETGEQLRQLPSQFRESPVRSAGSLAEGFGYGEGFGLLGKGAKKVRTQYLTQKTRRLSTPVDTSYEFKQTEDVYMPITRGEAGEPIFRISESGKIEGSYLGETQVGGIESVKVGKIQQPGFDLPLVTGEKISGELTVATPTQTALAKQLGVKTERQTQLFGKEYNPFTDYETKYKPLELTSEQKTYQAILRGEQKRLGDFGFESEIVSKPSLKVKVPDSSTQTKFGRLFISKKGQARLSPELDIDSILEGFSERANKFKVNFNLKEPGMDFKINEPTNIKTSTYLGSVESTSQTQPLAINNKIAYKMNVPSKENIFSREKILQKPYIKDDIIVQPTQKIVSITGIGTKIITKQKQDIIQMPKQIVEPISIQEIKTRQKNKFMTQPKQIQKPSLQRIKIPEFGKKQYGEPGFNIFTKIAGKEVKVNAEPLSMQDAIRKGQFVGGTTARASYKIIPAFAPAREKFKGGTVFPEDFYKSRTGWMVEKPSRRIKSSGELQEITYKGMAVKKLKGGGLWKKKR